MRMLTATQTSASGTYIINTPAFSDVEDGSGNRLRCSYISYDGQSYTTGQASGLTGGSTTATATYDNLGQVTSLQDPDGGTTTATYDPNGNVTRAVDARGSAGTIYASYDGLNRLLRSEDLFPLHG